MIPAQTDRATLDRGIVEPQPVLLDLGSQGSQPHPQGISHPQDFRATEEIHHELEPSEPGFPIIRKAVPVGVLSILHQHGGAVDRTGRVGGPQKIFTFQGSDSSGKTQEGSRLTVQRDAVFVPLVTYGAGSHRDHLQGERSRGFAILRQILSKKQIGPSRDPDTITTNAASAENDLHRFADPALHIQRACHPGVANLRLPRRIPQPALDDLIIGVLDLGVGTGNIIGTFPFDLQKAV